MKKIFIMLILLTLACGLVFAKPKSNNLEQPSKMTVKQKAVNNSAVSGSVDSIDSGHVKTNKPSREGNTVTIGDEDSQDYWSDILFNYYYANNVNQNLYLESEINKKGKIEALVFPFSGMGDITEGLPVKLWLGTTTKTDFLEFEETDYWMPYEDFTLVFSGALDVSEEGVYDVVIELDTPYDYTGGNLVIMTHRVFRFEGDCFDEFNEFKYTETADESFRCVSIESDDTDLDPSEGYLDDPWGYDAYANVTIVFSNISNEFDIVTIPANDRLMPNYPNPFNPVTNISFEISKAGNIQLDIYNSKGQKVRNLVNSDYQVGRHTVVWNGKDDTGKNVSSGIYYYQMTASEGVSTRKMLLIK